MPAQTDAMWIEYTDATTSHLNLQLSLYMAVTGEDRERETALSELLLVAEERRRTARDVLRRCERAVSEQ